MNCSHGHDWIQANQTGFNVCARCGLQQEKPPTSDAEHASRIKDLVKQLQSTIDDATYAGLQVNVAVSALSTFQLGNSSPVDVLHLSVDIARPL